MPGSLRWQPRSEQSAEHRRSCGPVRQRAPGPLQGAQAVLTRDCSAPFPRFLFPIASAVHRLSMGRSAPFNGGDGVTLTGPGLKFAILPIRNRSACCRPFNEHHPATDLRRMSLAEWSGGALGWQLPPRVARPRYCAERAPASAPALEYIGYYHDDRTHLGLSKRTPGGRRLSLLHGRVTQGRDLEACTIATTELPDIGPSKAGCVPLLNGRSRLIQRVARGRFNPSACAGGLQRLRQ